MRKHLYFICPTDRLEAVINARFKQENYYWTSLGNSVSFDNERVGEINALMETKSITGITFVLSDDNCMFLDALKDREFSSING